MHAAGLEPCFTSKKISFATEVDLGNREVRHRHGQSLQGNAHH